MKLTVNHIASITAAQRRPYAAPLTIDVDMDEDQIREAVGEFLTKLTGAKWEAIVKYWETET